MMLVKAGEAVDKFIDALVSKLLTLFLEAGTAVIFD